MGEFRCNNCHGTHPQQVFISHSRADQPFIKRAADQLCNADVKPLLFELEGRASDGLRNGPASQQIMGELKRSLACFVLLGPEAAKRSWTQAWIAFELGFFKGSKSGPSVGEGAYALPDVVLVENISQESDAAMPNFDIALLLDFFDGESWKAIATLASLRNPDVAASAELFREANQLRFFQLLSPQNRFQCPHQSCRASYELYVWAGKCERDHENFPIIPGSFSLKCSVCRKQSNILAEGHTFTGSSWTPTVVEADYVPEVPLHRHC